MPKITNFSLGRNSESPKDAPALKELRKEAQSQARTVIALADEWGSHDKPVTFKEFEKALRTALFVLAGRMVVMLFLAKREQRVMREHPGTVLRGRRRFRRSPAQARNLSTRFGVVRYRRTYFREVAKKKRRGFYPLDVALGLTADRFSWNVLSHAARLASKMSFADLIAKDMELSSGMNVWVPTAHSGPWLSFQPGTRMVIEDSSYSRFNRVIGGSPNTSTLMSAWQVSPKEGPRCASSTSPAWHSLP